MNSQVDITENNVVFAIRETAREVLPSDATVILFGSRARGDATSESDWDLLILMNQETRGYDNFSAYAYPFIDAGWRHGAQINPKLYSRAEWSKGQGTPFYNNVMRDGIRL